MSGSGAGGGTGGKGDSGALAEWATAVTGRVATPPGTRDAESMSRHRPPIARRVWERLAFHFLFKTFDMGKSAFPGVR
jgi:hypothetical protein